MPGARGAGMSDHRGMIDRQQGHSTCMFRSSTGKICPYSVFPIRALPTYRYDLRDRRTALTRPQYLVGSGR